MRKLMVDGEGNRCRQAWFGFDNDSSRENPNPPPSLSFYLSLSLSPHPTRTFLPAATKSTTQAIITGKRKLEKQLSGLKKRRIASTHFVMRRQSAQGNVADYFGSPMQTVLDFMEGLRFDDPNMQRQVAAVRHILSTMNTRNLFTPDLKAHFSSSDLTALSKSGRSAGMNNGYTEETKAWLNQQLIEDQLDEVTREINLDLDEELVRRII